MGQVLHGSATTTEAVSRAIERSEESLRVLARRHGLNQKTVAKWKKRTSTADLAMALAAGDAWLEKGANLLLFGGPGGGKTHLAATLGLALVENGWRVLFTRTTDLVQKLQAARRDLALESVSASGCAGAWPPTAPS